MSWGVAVLLAAALLVSAWPLFAALWWLRRVTAPPPLGLLPADAKVVLVLPYAPPGDLGPLCRALAAQSLRPERLILAVARLDHAPRLPPLPFPHVVVVAGRARERGQKCHNLLAALDAVPGDASAVVLLDADILPQPWWLAALVGPVLRGSHQIAGGYRWPVPDPDRPLAQGVAWLDRAVALLPKPRWLGIAWGGSLALAPAILPLVKQVFERAVSDDLMLARRARQQGLGFVIRGAVLLPSPLGAGAFAFWARQLRVTRLHHRPLWWGQAASTHALLLLWLFALGQPWPWLLAWLLAQGALRAAVQDLAARRIGAPDPPATRAWQILCAATPLPDLLSAAALWHSAFGRHLLWRGITYRIERDGSARVEAMG
ncbi:MAG: glycosyltransferase [Rhodovarius sp.]|nr:hypothetical protein [Rhodovarius sp.]MDW8314842.1 glycosyltransferase [Rhodovarius sp.]